ncbi:hypothetical protein Cni_G25355 [Canna indica]|uniref:LysM domain-containing protein n=1 Tax=Canna indica TaxID=4628 RepID=A0AAQ3L0Y2_9LILI|nr:hypothetical protein Cni_G25355 [Canna indica]
MGRGRFVVQFSLSYLVLRLFSLCHSRQQYYDGNDTLDDDGNRALGYSCIIGVDPLSCDSFLTFRTDIAIQSFQSIFEIASLLNVDAADTAAINGVHDSRLSLPLPEDQPLLLVPATCSCSGGRYSHNASYWVKAGDTYYLASIGVFQNLTTWPAMDDANPLDVPTNLSIGRKINVPLRCACPAVDQLADGVKYLLTYVVGVGDTVQSLARRFQVDYQQMLEANNLTVASRISAFTTLLVPLEAKPTKEQFSLPASPFLPLDSVRIADTDIIVKVSVRVIIKIP